MADRVAAPQTYARVAGLLYLVGIVAGFYAEIFVRGAVVVTNDAAATAQNIVTHELQYRLGFAAELIEVLCNVPLMLIFYELFKVVNKRVALLMMFFGLLGSAIESFNLINHFAPLTFLGGGRSLSAIPVEQLQAQAYLSLKLFDVGYAISLVFYGASILCLGFLIFQSDFLPRIIGVLLMFEAVCYVANSFAHFLALSIAPLLFSVLMISFVGEFSLCLWLLVMGVNVPKWEAQTSRSVF
jgi:hypothetical protein